MGDPAEELTGQQTGLTEPPMISLAEAAVLAGRHPEALRSMIRRGQLSARRDNRRGWLVAAPQPAGTAAEPVENTSRPPSDRLIPDMEDALAELREEVAGLREALGRSEAGREAAVALARKEGELEAAKAQAEATVLRELVAELKAALVDARRPWWRRWMGKRGRRIGSSDKPGGTDLLEAALAVVPRLGREGS